jgi:hypothetical protein
MGIKDLHVAIYGKVKIVRGYCTDCERITLLYRNRTLKNSYLTNCCDSKLVIEVKGLPVKRMLEER